MKTIKNLLYSMIMFVKKERDKRHRIKLFYYCIYEFPSSRERNMISSELGVDKEKFKKATKEPYSFLYVDKPKKNKKEFLWKYINV